MLSVIKRSFRYVLLFSILLLAISHLISHRSWTPQRLSNFLKPANTVIMTSTTESPRRGTTLPRIIVDWTTFFNSSIESSLFRQPITECPIKCIFTSNKSQVANADAVIYHIRDFKPNEIPKVRHPFQRYVFYLMESPIYSGKPIERIPKNFFNMTMTYRLDSDVVVGYDWLISKQAAKRSNYSPVAYSWDHVLSVVSKKTKLVAIMVSHCDTESRREKYVAELSRFLPVDSYGSCSGVKCENCEEMLTNDYMFYLAFENSVCRDYVTEKFWRIKRLIVPIVLRKADYLTIAPNGSFIAADQFKSSKDLAEYLQYLSSNRTEYLKYFEWTKHYWSSSELWRHYCELCKAMYNDSVPAKSYKNVEKWWTEGGNCQIDFAERLLPFQGFFSLRKLFLLLPISAVALFLLYHAQNKIPICDKATDVL